MSCLLREYEELLRRADTVCALATELDFPFMLAWGLAFRGIAKLNLGNANGEEALRDGLALLSTNRIEVGVAVRGWQILRASHAKAPMKPWRWCKKGWMLSRRLVSAGMRPSCTVCAAPSLKPGTSLDDGLAENDLLHRKADCGGGQGAKLLELRAAVSLARLWGEQGRRVEARGTRSHPSMAGSPRASIRPI